jgi:N-acetyl-gamma-glutamyl-phosphate reductase
LAAEAATASGHYGFEDSDAAGAAELSDRAVYGLPELNSDLIAGAALVANPGCYATSVILALAPLLKAGVVDRSRGIISDSKSGVSGAGKEPTAKTHFVSVADNLSAYSVFNHRHLGEIVEQLALGDQELIFTPHLLPIPRGILSTIYVHLNRAMTALEVESCLRTFYSGKRWVRIFQTPKLPQVQFSLHSNYCDLGFVLAEDGRRLVLISCIDNLVKGAAGQAVQNMNVMYGWGEEEGLQ